MKDWYRDWFNTPEYLNVYRHRNQSDAHSLVELILKNVTLKSGAKVLDLACGTGRHSIYFAEKGFKVTAIDLSSNLLSAAKSLTERIGLKIQFLERDMRDLNFEKEFDLIVNLFTSFGYFESDSENFSIIKGAYNLLLDKGYFVIDFFNADYIMKNLVPESEEKFLDEIIIQRRRIENGRVVKNILVKQNGTEKNYIESVRLFTSEELKIELVKTGFKIIKCFGDFNGSDFDLNSSQRIIIIAQK
ncbi:MAG: class I SAM-dependent methyltransferase [Ignavibacteriaceae bacterium]|nr:class I SAM-dependent methyltransferase [Ignavibacteriaceae bacterium]